MRRELKKIFKAVTSDARKTAIALTAAFALAAGISASPAMAQEKQLMLPSVPNEVAYWKHQDYPIVVKTEPCAERGICISLHSVDPDNKDIKDLASTAMERPAAEITRNQILTYCGKTADTKLKPSVSVEGQWNGTVYNHFNNKSYGMMVTPQLDGSIKVIAYLQWFPLASQSFKAKRITDLPPACTPPDADTPAPPVIDTPKPPDAPKIS